MTPERLERIQDLYHSTRDASADECAALLARADPELRSEVESLLAHSNDYLILDRSTPLPGARLGPYVVESKLGEGGMGAVFSATDTRLDRAVAIKFAHQQFSAPFEREARAIASLNHPHICTLYDIGPNYLVMELLEGETLAARLKYGPLPLDEALRYISQIAAALADAHRHGIIHRDLKPGNIMLVKSGAKVLDFGLAIRQGDDDTITGRHMAFGTPAYMAPEQREGRPADVRTDIYSFGLIFREMLTGESATSNPKTLPSKTLEAIASRCLKTDPAQRWQSAAELVNAIQIMRPERNGLRWLAGAAILFTVLALSYVLFRPAPKLTDKDIIVLADFVNNTGDPIFEGTLRQGLAIQLEQSPFLKIMDDEQVQRILRLMSLTPGARVTNSIAREICVREGAVASIDGAIAGLGKSYILTLQAVSCQSGETLAREQIQAQAKEQVLSALAIAAATMRAKLGESHSSIQKLSRPLEQATTPSLEALQNYTAGYSEMVQGHSMAAVPLMKRAVALDPNFAMAYQYLGVAYEVAGDMARSRAYSQQAFNLIDRVSEFERDIIAPYYYLDNGEVDKAMDGYRRSSRNYPRFWGFHNYLGMIDIDLGQYEEGLKEGLEAARLQPDAEPPYRRQLDAYLCMDQLSEAKRLAQKLRTQGLDRARIHQRFFEMAYIEDDQAAAAKEIQWFAGKQEEYLSFGLQAADRNLHGQRRESRNLYQRAADTSLRRKLPKAAAEFEEAAAQADALSGDCRTALRLGRPALALAICGDAATAEKIITDTSRLFRNGTIWNAVQLPEIRAAIALKRDHPADSIGLLASAVPYERAYPEVSYLRGLAYLHLHKGGEAVAEFQKITDHKGANWGSAWRYPYWGQFYSLSFLGVARGSALAGNAVKARKAYQDFFGLWRAADPEIPILWQARAEYAKVR